MDFTKRLFTICLIFIFGLTGCVTTGVGIGASNGTQPVAGNSETGGTKQLQTCNVPVSQRLSVNLDLGGDADTQIKYLVKNGLPSNPLPAMRLIAQQSGCFTPSAYTKAMERAGRNTTADYTLLVEIITSNENESGGGAAGAAAGIGSLFGPVGMVVGAIAGSIRKSEAGVILTMVSNKDGEQIASASGVATGTSFGLGGGLGVAGAGGAIAGGLGGYENTDQGKVIIGAMIDAVNKLTPMIPQLQASQRVAPVDRASTNLVQDIQAALKVKGYSVSVDGQYGPMTKAAIADWQKKNGLPADGKPSQSLLDAMRK
ncbi:hypothetical protein A2524_00955 [Candidatus Wolfebacteria bacterium RIFOXYD12_FULL_48_21]|uniref:Peptidoglycan binding-like domain-containing protein n=1 Tax=Candidatus Wolfebacteria bacterium RIFOXYD1_FULL_48_65 TaxID=1802561 RepID=A0A1F8E046_9BACT|nr:MAG: hypothetical protein A2610_02900 [Candidatus Wolfebacteria bacterium RIFOXYD1_FULL_48_65]OGM94377.1 MAG: hypothetical protein A2524_00955 [Candidatus Wolfebacteria bacterium RIFOXYD12_FULL_48_21]